MSIEHTTEQYDIANSTQYQHHTGYMSRSTGDIYTSNYLTTCPGVHLTSNTRNYLTTCLGVHLTPDKRTYLTTCLGVHLTPDKRTYLTTCLGVHLTSNTSN